MFRHLRFLFERERKWIEDKLKEEEEAGELKEGMAEILDEEHAKKPARKMFKRAKLLTVYHSIQTVGNVWNSVT